MKNSLLAALGFTAIFLTCLAEEDKNVLSDAERAQLQRDKMIITGRSHKQIFSPYVFSDKPVFITTDSVINAWHVLLEDSVRTMEERFADVLPDSLDKALDSLPKQAPEGIAQELFDSAVRRTRLVLGTASKLAGGRWSGGKELDELIVIDVRRAVNAREIALPEWLAKEGWSIQGFDYAVFRPAGIYAENARMQRYFRAVRWLQTVPFDLKRDDQLASMWLIASALEDSDTVLRISEAFHKLLGKGSERDAWSLSSSSKASCVKTPAKWLEELKSNFGSENSEKAMNQPAVVLSARALADVELFAKTTGKDRPLPSTLEAAALYGSPLAMNLLNGEKSILAKIEEARANLQEDETLQGSYFRCLTELFAKPEPEAPDFMKSEPWQRKSLNTCLTGWVQFRHTWTLQGKENAHYFGIADSNPLGFVEPNPEFYRHLAALATYTRQIFDRFDQKAVSSLDISRRAADLLPLIEDTVEPLRKLRLAEKEGRESSKAEMNELELKMRLACDKLVFFIAVLGDAGGFMSVSGGAGGMTEIVSFSDPESLLVLLKKIADGEKINEMMAKLAPSLERSQQPDRWQALSDICHQLETLAHKQLRGVDPAKDEVVFIKTYGEKLAKVMLYDGNSWLVPRDDAPRISSIFNQPGHGFLLGGVGRPREIWVLYPWRGREIACRGAVMPFLEMQSDKHLTDKEWKQVLGGSACPENPEWLRPVITNGER